MKLVQFRVQNYRNILDSGPIEVGKVTAFVGQNEAGKSNLFEALYCINPITPEAYKPDEDWPVDQWDGRATANGKEVCSAEFALSEAEIRDVFKFAAPPEPPPPADTPEGSAKPAAPAPIPLPNDAMVICLGGRGWRPQQAKAPPGGNGAFSWRSGAGGPRAS